MWYLLNKCSDGIQEGNWNNQISEVYRISNNTCENFWNLDIPRGVNLLNINELI